MTFQALFPYLTDEADADIAARLCTPIWTAKQKFIDFTELSAVWGFPKQAAFEYALRQASKSDDPNVAAPSQSLVTLLTGRGFWAANPQVNDEMLQGFVALSGGAITFDDAKNAVATSALPLGEAVTAEQVAAARIAQAKLSQIEALSQRRSTVNWKLSQQTDYLKQQIAEGNLPDVPTWDDALLAAQVEA